MVSYSYILPLCFLIFLIFFLITFLIFAKATYKTTTGETYMFRRYFPFELFHQNKINIVSYVRLMLILFFAIMLASVVIFVTAFRNETSNLFYAIALGIFYVVAMLVSLVTFILKPNYLKQFILYCTLVFVLNLMSNATLGIICFTGIFTHVAYKIIGGFAFALSGFNLILTINPKLRNWSKLETQKNQDGTLSYIRPKISPLAFSLWLSYATLIAGVVLILIVLLLGSFNF